MNTAMLSTVCVLPFRLSSRSWSFSWSRAEPKLQSGSGDRSRSGSMFRIGSSSRSWSMFRIVRSMSKSRSNNGNYRI